MPSNLVIGVGLDLARLIADKAALQLEMKDLAAKLREATKVGDTAAVGELSTDLARATLGLQGVNHEMVKLRTESKGGFGEIRAAFGELIAAGREFRATIGEIAERVIPHFKEVAALSFGAAALELSKMTIEANAAVRATDNLARSLGVGGELVEKFKLAGAQAGADPERSMTALGRLMARVGEAREDVLKLQQDLQNGAKGAGDKAQQQLSTFGDSGTIFRGGVRPVVDFSKPLSVLGVNVGGFANSPEGNEKLLLAIGAAFDKVTDSSVRARVAQQLFGREWRNQLPVFLDLNRQMRIAAEVIETYKLGGDELEKELKTRSDAFNKAYETLKFVIEQEKKIVGAAIGQAFVPIFTGLTDLLGNNTQTIKKWADDTAAAMKPVAQDILSLLRGGSLADVKTPWLADFLGALKAIGQAVIVIKDIVVYAFRQMKEALQLPADLLNGMFGTKLTGEVAAFSLVIFGLVGGFKAVKVAIEGAYASYKLFKALFVGETAAAGAGAAAGGAAAAGGGLAALVRRALGVIALPAVLRGDTATGPGMAEYDKQQASAGPGFFGQGGTLERLITGAAGEATAAIPPAPAPPPIPSSSLIQQIIAAARGSAAQGSSNSLPVSGGIENPNVRWSTNIAEAMNGFAKSTTDGLKQHVTEAVEILKGGVHAETESLKTAAGQSVNILRGGLGSVGSEIVDAAGTAVAILRGLKPVFHPSQPYTPGVPGGQSGIGGGAQGVFFADGGAVSGAGTSTSDSIRAWLSNGEYVLNAAAVRRYGRGMLDAMNGLRAGAQFAMGGFVDSFASLRPMPAFADGGMVAGGALAGGIGGLGNNIFISLDGRQYGPMKASRSVTDELVRDANRAQRVSLGPAPSWQG